MGSSQTGATSTKLSSSRSCSTRGEGLVERRLVDPVPSPSIGLSLLTLAREVVQQANFAEKIRYKLPKVIVWKSHFDSRIKQDQAQRIREVTARRRRIIDYSESTDREAKDAAV